MAFTDTSPLPLLLPWVDWSPYAGKTFGGVSIPSTASLGTSVFAFGGASQGINTVVSSLNNGTISFEVDGMHITWKNTGGSVYPQLYSLNSGAYLNAQRINAANMLCEMRCFNYDVSRSNIIQFTVYTSSSSSSNKLINTANGFGSLTMEQRTPSVFSPTNHRTTSSETFNNALTRKDEQLYSLANSGILTASEKELKSVGLQRCRLTTHAGVIGFAPSRPVQNLTLLEQITSVDHISLGGKPYHSQHSKRRLWQVELILDGPLDDTSSLLSSGGFGGWLEATSGWDLFLDCASKGVTLYLDRTGGQGPFVRPKEALAFPGMPNRICGQIQDASNLKLAPSNGLARRYSVTLTICEDEP